jgi:hypothetical protein
MAQQDYGSDVWNKRKIFEIFVILISIAILSFLTINTILWEVAQTFWIFGLMGIIGITVAHVISGKGKTDVIDVAIAEEGILPINQKVLYILFFVAFLGTFFMLANTDYRIAAPAFELVDLGLGGSAMLTFAAAIMEDIFFFVLIPGLVFSGAYWLTKRFWVSIILVMLICPTVFMLYHLNVYGFANQAAMMFVFVFGAEMTGMMLLLRNVMYVHMRHVGNNLGILIFDQMSFETFMTVVIGSPITWGIVAILIIIGFVKLRS